MTIERHWISWCEPCLPQAAGWLVDRFARKSTCDLRGTLCVLPGRRAGRLLLAELLRECGRRNLLLIPPRTVTPGAMVDDVLLCDSDTPALATAHESRLAWAHALRMVTDADLRLLAAQRPGEDDWPTWSALARTLQGLHETLAGDLRDFSDAADAAARLGMPGEGERWSAIAAVQTLQRGALARAGLVERHDARRDALDHAIRAAAQSQRPARSIVLIGTADLNALQKAVLRLQSNAVCALVHAPSSLADDFDDLGTVRAEALRERPIDVPDDRIHVVQRPTDQAQAALRVLASLDGCLAASQVTLGLGEASMLGDLRVAAQWAGLSVHDPTGTPLRRSAPWRLLDAARRWLEDPRFEHLATLLRHVDVEHCVASTAHRWWAHADADAALDSADSHASAIDRTRAGHVEWLTILDRYFADHLQGRLSGSWLGDEPTRNQLRAVHAAVQAMLAPVNVDAAARRPLSQWSQPLLDVLANVYAQDAHASDDDDRRAQSPWQAADLRSIDAVLAMRDGLHEIAEAASPLQPAVNSITAIGMLLESVGDIAVASERAADSIEVLGWLELHLDPAPALVITGLNDGAVPEALTGHAYLPDSLRTALGMANNAHRLARDAYLLQAIVCSRPHVHMIVGRRDARGEPLAPSRLLLTCDDQTLVRRVRNFAEDRSGAVPAPVGLPQSAPASRSAFVIPVLPALTAPAAMRVTEFAAYLMCPYRYALQRLLGLEPLTDECAELNPMSFGTLTHEVLATLGDDREVADSGDADTIFEYLCDRLQSRVRERFGAQPLPAVRLQIARLEQRLRSFAHFQAREASQGWRIVHCERSFRGEVSLDLPGEEPLPLRGSIDRIDENVQTRRWRLLDYKTSESARSPIQTHHELKRLPAALADLRWRDLQLPLYHLLATRSELALPGDQIELGYVVLPKQSAGVRWLVADWTVAHIEHGIEAARNVVRAIRRGEFNVDRIARDYSEVYDDFARICQTTVFRAEAETGESDDEDDSP